MTRQDKGYTLAEILIVVSIIVVLGVALLIGINPMAQIFKGYDAHRRADLNKLKIALEAYYSDHDCYPPFPDKDALGYPTYTCDSDMLVPYLDSMPCDPNTKKPYSLYLTPLNSTCPQQFAVYAQIYSFFDSKADSLAYCPKTIFSNSPNMTLGQLNSGCAQINMCPSGIYYGCKAGACVPISAYGELPDINCLRSYCPANCYDRCPTEEDSCP